MNITPCLHRWMCRYRATTIFSALVLGVGGLFPACAAEPLHAEDIMPLAPQIRADVRAAMQTWGVPGLAIGIVADDRLAWASGFGVRTQGQPEPVDVDTVFQIGSASKAFLGVTLAQLVDQHRLQWTDRVIDRWPDFRLHDAWVTREFRIADLLAQRSGLPGYALTNMMFYDYKADDIIRALRHIEPVSSFRSEFAYQNAFHLLAGKIAAQAADRANWGDVVDALLFDPLGMNTSSTTAEGLSASGNHASSHRGEAGRIVVDPMAPFPYNAAGAGAINSNVRDMAQWLRMQINGGRLGERQIVSSAQLRQTHVPRIALTPEDSQALGFTDGDQVSYATGWLVHSLPQGRFIDHSGATAGFTSFVGFDPDRRIGVVILTNYSEDIGIGLAVPLAMDIVDRIQGRPFSNRVQQWFARKEQAHREQQAQLALPAQASRARPASDYAGSYSSPTMGDVTVRADPDGTLSFALGPHQQPVTLQHWSGDVFIASGQYPAQGPNAYTEVQRLRFLADECNRVAGFQWGGLIDSAGQPPFRRTRSQAESGQGSGCVSQKTSRNEDSGFQPSA